MDTYDRVYAHLHGANEAAHTQGTRDREAGRMLPRYTAADGDAGLDQHKQAGRQ